MKKLLIVESPAKIKTIAKFLGNEFTIMSTVGHIKDLPKKTLGITMGNTIELEYVAIDKKDKIIKDLVKEAKNSDEIYLAPDPDREGEIIALGEKMGIIKKSGNSYKYGEETLGRGYDSTRQFLKENTNLLN